MSVSSFAMRAALGSTAERNAHQQRGGAGIVRLAALFSDAQVAQALNQAAADSQFRWDLWMLLTQFKNTRQCDKPFLDFRGQVAAIHQAAIASR